MQRENFVSTRVIYNDFLSIERQSIIYTALPVDVIVIVAPAEDLILPDFKLQLLRVISCTVVGAKSHSLASILSQLL